MHLRLRKCEKSPQTYCKLADLRVAEHLLQFCGIECKFAVPSSGKNELQLLMWHTVSPMLGSLIVSLTW